jgi:hypothetical protein
MAIEKNAIREGSRWMLHGSVVEVLEVTSRSVIYSPENAFTKVETLEAFATHASDPATAEHDHLLRVFGSWHEGMAAPKPQDLHQAISYLLTRLGPPAPANIVPAAPTPKPASVAIAMPAVEVEEGPCDVALPAYEPLVVEDEPPARKRRFA